MQVEPAAVAVSGFAHDAFVLESEALVEVASAGVVVEDVEKESVCAEFAEGDPDDLAENEASEATSGRGDDDSLEFDGAGAFGEAAEDHVGVYAGAVLVDVVAGVFACDGDAMTVFAPLTNELAAGRSAFDGEDCGDVVDGGEAKGHGDWKIVGQQGTTGSKWHESPVSIRALT